MNTLDPQTMACLVVLYQIGNGTPIYLFEGIDIQDAVSNGYLTVKNNTVWMTTQGENTLKEFMDQSTDTGLN